MCDVDYPRDAIPKPITNDNPLLNPTSTQKQRTVCNVSFQTLSAVCTSWGDHALMAPGEHLKFSDPTPSDLWEYLPNVDKAIETELKSRASAPAPAMDEAEEDDEKEQEKKNRWKRTKLLHGIIDTYNRFLGSSESDVAKVKLRCSYQVLHHSNDSLIC